MSVPQPDRMEDFFFDENLLNDMESNVDSRRTLHVDIAKRHCSCDCICCNSGGNENDKDNSATSTPSRGRSLTPKYDRTNGNGGPPDTRPTADDLVLARYNTANSVNGQEGLASHQLEAATKQCDQDSQAVDSIHRWLAQHHESENPFCFPYSPSASILVEASTASPSLASSGFLPPRAASSAELMAFTTGGFDEGSILKASQCAFTPLRLTHEMRYCRNMQFGSSSKIGSNYMYPVTIDLGGQ